MNPLNFGFFPSCRRLLVPLMLILMAMFLLMACDRDDAPSQPKDDPSSAVIKPRLGTSQASREAEQAEPERPRDIAVVQLLLGNAMNDDKSIDQPTEQFSPQDTVYAVVVTHGYTTSSRVMVLWHHASKPEIAQSNVVIASDGEARTVFKLARPDGLPEGQYTLDVLLDGEEAINAAFRVARKR